jgi:hypothetical protein
MLNVGADKGTVTSLALSFQMILFFICRGKLRPSEASIFSGVEGRVVAMPTAIRRAPGSACDVRRATQSAGRHEEPAGETESSSRDPREAQA